MAGRQYLYGMVVLCFKLIFSAPLAAMVPAGTKTYNITAYGASSNLTDNRPAIQRCADAAVKSGSAVIVIPDGRYNISEPIEIQSATGYIEIRGEGKTPPELHSTANTSVLNIRGIYHVPALGVVCVNNLQLSATNPAYSAHHLMAGGPRHNAGLLVTDKQQAIIKNVTIRDVYGSGIYIAVTQPTGIPLAARFANVDITGCSILNCWGYNPAKDDYGDGIYLADFAGATVAGNKVWNDVSITGVPGRAGIVLEYLAENATLTGNTVGGYDRAVHIEADRGGHSLTGNRLTCLEMGLVVVNEAGVAGKPLVVTGNTFTNNLLPAGRQVKRVRGIYSLADRPFIEILTPGSTRAGSVVKDNTFTIDGNYEYKSTSVLNIRGNGWAFTGNTFRLRNANGIKYTPGIYDAGNDTRFDNNDLSAVKVYNHTGQRPRTLINRVTGKAIETKVWM